MTHVSYSCTALPGKNKVGLLKPDDNGYYEMVVGAIGIENRSGEFYEATNDVVKLFGPGTSLHRRIANGQCRGELGHPKKTPGMTMQDYVNRILRIEETNTCSHFKEIRLDSEVVKDDKGNKVLATIAKLKAAGPQAEQLKEALANPDENVAFSIRSLTANRVEGGRLVKTLRTVVGWDQVNEQGVVVAHKYGSPALEELNEDSVIILPAHLDAMENNSETIVALESSGLSTTMLRTDLGWVKTQIINPPSSEW